MTGGMIIAGSIIGGRALAPVEGIIASWRNLVQAREADSRIRDLLARTGEIIERVPLQSAPNHENIAYLRTKQAKLGHLRDLDDEGLGGGS